MRRTITLLAITAFYFAVFNTCNDKKNTKPDDIQLGMLFEKRDKLAGIPLASTPFGGDELPASVDLSDKMPPVGNQGDQQSCVAWAIAYALKSYQEKLELGQQFKFSPSYIYNQINNGQNVPTYMTDALNLLSQQGVCFYDDMPYNPQDWVSKPTEEQREKAKQFKIDYWRQVNVADVKEVKAQLSAGYPVVIGADVSNEFINDGRQEKANYIWKNAGTPAGGHAMLLVGYDDAKGAFKLMNSWGPEWGDNGFAWVTYELFPQVCKYGFVAKDSYSGQVDTNNTTTTKKDQYDENYYDNKPLNPNDNPNAFDTINFRSTNVQHNVENDFDPSNGPAMRVEGALNIPKDIGKKFQVVVHVYDAQTNRQVPTLIYPTYSDINHFAAGYTQELDVVSGFKNGTWWIQIPYSALNIPPGQTVYMYAVPTLFLDNFGVAIGERIDFWVRK
jgi:C1A family cysteine protease